MTSGQFLVTSDILAMRHLQGPGVVDSHGDSASRNLLKFFQKCFRMKMWSLRGTYSSPFQVYQNSTATHRRCPGGVRLAVGAAHTGRRHMTWTLGHQVLEVLEFAEAQVERCALYNECEYTFKCFCKIENLRDFWLGRLGWESKRLSFVKWSSRFSKST